LGAGAIEPDQVVGVVDHAHLIGLGVVDAERYRADHAGATSTSDRQKSNTTGACGRFARFLAWGVPAPASRVLVVADAHLGQVPPAVAAAFHRFLDAVPDLGDALLINGDLLDFWFEYRAVIPRRRADRAAVERAADAPRDPPRRHHPAVPRAPPGSGALDRAPAVAQAGGQDPRSSGGGPGGARASPLRRGAAGATARPKARDS